MKRLKVLFAILLFCLFLPFWRMLDYLVILSPSSLLYAGAFTLLCFLFLMLPSQMIFQFKRWYMAFASGALLVLMLNLSPLSSKTTLHPEYTHCGALTYTGFLHPIYEFLNEANADDLLIRNQLCWVRKLIVKTPNGFATEEDQAAFTMLVHKKLMLPTEKFQTSLPLIALLHGELAMKSGDPKFLYDSLHFWKEHYTLQLKNKPYQWWDWPHSAWIKFEYGLIENNWESILENIEISP